MYILYTDDCILEVPDEIKPSQIVYYIKVEGLYLTEEGNIGDFLGVNIDKVDSYTYYLSQPQLTN